MVDPRDQELRELAASGKLSTPDVLAAQTERLLSDSRAERFSRHFVRQWLGMQLLDFLEVDEKVYGRVFDDESANGIARPSA